MLSVASAIRLVLFVCLAVGLDQRQALHQAFVVFNAKPSAHQRQASPVQPAHAVGQKVEHLEGQQVFSAGARQVIAFILDTGL
jgi:hypothetical protein